MFAVRPIVATIAAAFAFTACDDDRALRRSSAIDAASPDEIVDASADVGAMAPVTHDVIGAITETEEDIGTSLCPGVRLYRVNRHRVGAPASAPAPMPRYFGRTELGQPLTWRDVLLCELRIMHWVDHTRDEGAYLIMWRGPAILEAESDCDWREPFESVRTPGGRRLTFHEHCRRRDRPGPTDRLLSVEVDDTYQDLRLR